MEILTEAQIERQSRRPDMVSCAAVGSPILMHQKSRQCTHRLRTKLISAHWSVGVATGIANGRSRVGPLSCVGPFGDRSSCYYE